MSDRPNPTVTVEPATTNDLRDALMGTPGNPTYEEQWGITATPPGQSPLQQPSLAELELAAEQAMARAINPNDPGVPQAAAAEIGAIQEELARFKKLYGDSENEKGELRRQFQELNEAFTGLMAQVESQSATPPAPQWGPVAPQQYPAPAPQFNPLADIDDDSFVEGKKVKRLIEEGIAPAIAGLYQQLQQTQARAAAAERQAAMQARAALGITQLDEYRLTGKNPWLRNLPEPQRLQAMQALKAQERAVSPQQQVPTQTPSEAQQRVLSKVTFVEGNTPNVPDTSEGALEAARQRDYARVMAQPVETGARARAFREFAAKYGLSFGQNPSDLSR